MSNYESKIIERVLNVIDSDDIQETALFVESNLTKEQICKLQKMLNAVLKEKQDTSDRTQNIKQFLYFIE